MTLFALLGFPSPRWTSFIPRVCSYVCVCVCVCVLLRVRACMEELMHEISFFRTHKSIWKTSKVTPSGECPHLDFYLSNRSSIHETIRYAPTERKKKEAAKRHSHPPIEVIEHNGDIVMGVPPTTTLQV